jgi:hypothetical protein
MVMEKGEENMGKPIIGMNLNQKPGTLTFPCPLPFSSYRFWDDGCYWSQVNPEPSVFDFTTLDWWVKNLSGKDGLFVLGGPPPSWATANGTVPSDLSPDGAGPNLHWRRWVAAVSGRLAGMGAGYEIWNEFVNPARWSGTLKQMQRLAEDARAIIGGRGRITATGESVAQVLLTVGLKAPTNPKAVILSPSGYANQPVFLNYLELAGETTEAIELHTYKKTAAESLADIELMRVELSKLKINAPIWIGECSWGKWNNAIISDQEKAAWVQEFFGGNPAIDRFYWYGGNDGAVESGPPDPSSTGCLYSAGQLTPAGHAWVVAAGLTW